MTRRQLGAAVPRFTAAGKVTHMKLERIGLLVPLLGSLALSTSCTATKGCTDIGCIDQFSAVIEAPSVSLPAGAHRLDVSADGTTLSCTFALPVEPLPSGGLPAPACAPGLMLVVGPAVTCTTFEDSASKGRRCDPVPDRVQERLTVAGTPTNVTVTQWAGDTTIFQQTATPTYQVSRPNGPECEPACRQASTTWSIP